MSKLSVTKLSKYSKIKKESSQNNIIKMKQNQGPRKVVGDYEIHMDKRLGQGMSGTVY